VKPSSPEEDFLYP